MAILRVKDENGNTIDIPAIVGPQGPIGPQGPEGPQGPAGPAGEGGSGGGFVLDEYVTPVSVEGPLYCTNTYVKSCLYKIDLSSFIGTGLTPRYISVGRISRSEYVDGGFGGGLGGDDGEHDMSSVADCEVEAWVSPTNFTSNPDIFYDATRIAQDSCLAFYELGVYLTHSNLSMLIPQFEGENLYLYIRSIDRLDLTDIRIYV